MFLPTVFNFVFLLWKLPVKAGKLEFLREIAGKLFTDDV